MLKLIIWDELSNLEKEKILMRPEIYTKEDLVKQVAQIIKSVREDKDQACIAMTKAFDGVETNDLTINNDDIEKAYEQVSSSALRAMQRAIKQLYSFHSPQVLNNYQVETSPGIICENQIRPLQRIGIYVPGGSAPLVSTVLMIGVPAKIAGCPTRILCTPPDKTGRINPNILVAADLCGIDKIYKIGGAQAIAAMAYGTETIPKVDKVVGPGNAWVTEAKIQVSLDVYGAQTDLPAGPSEVMIIADEKANASFVAADLLSQAEHGVDSQTVLLCTDITVAERILQEIQSQLKSLKRCEIAKQSLSNSRFIIVDTIADAVDIANEYAPEHLILQVEQPNMQVEKIYAAGSIFLGPWSPEAAGDYASGTNHVLPTYGFAKNCSGLSVRDFVKTISIQTLTKEGLADIADTIRELATIEGLDAHKNAVDIRLRGNGYD